MQAVHEDRVVGDSCGQQGLVRVAVRPGAFVPAAADDPLAFRHRLCALDDHLDRLFLGRDADQVDLVQQRPEPEDVRMRVHQSGDDGGAREVDDPGGFSLEFHRLDIAAGEQDIAVPDGDGLRIRVPAGGVARCTRRGGTVRARFFPVQRVDAAVDEDEVGEARLDGGCGFVVGARGYQQQQQNSL